MDIINPNCCGGGGSGDGRNFSILNWLDRCSDCKESINSRQRCESHGCPCIIIQKPFQKGTSCTNINLQTMHPYDQ